MTDDFFEMVRLPATPTWLAECQRCAALVMPQRANRHRDWHCSVDSGATTSLPVHG